jgi:mandelate racemase
MKDLTIRTIIARAVNVPLKKPHPTAGGNVTSAPLVLIDLQTEEGITGHAYLFCYTALALGPVVNLLHAIGALITGEAVAPVAVHSKLQAKFRLLGAQGLIGMAIAGIDMALWDAKARAASLPLARLLGGQLRRVAAYHSCGMGGADGATQDAEETAALGFSAIKFKIGYGDVAGDLAAIRSARLAAPSLDIMVDYNQSLDVTAAIERAKALENENLVWIEEPTTADDYLGHAKIAAAAGTAIQIGENMWGPSDLAKAVAANASDYIMFDVMKIGGVTGWMRAAAIAQVSGLRVSTHLFPEISAQLQCVTPGAHLLEYQDWASPILRQPLQITDGMAVIRAEPGSGVSWDEAAVKHHLIDP